MRRARPDVTGFEDAQNGAQTQVGGLPLGGEKGKRTDAPPEPPERIQP